MGHRYFAGSHFFSHQSQEFIPQISCTVLKGNFSFTGFSPDINDSDTALHSKFFCLRSDKFFFLGGFIRTQAMIDIYSDKPDVQLRTETGKNMQKGNRVRSSGHTNYNFFSGGSKPVSTDECQYFLFERMHLVIDNLGLIIDNGVIVITTRLSL